MQHDEQESLQQFRLHLQTRVCNTRWTKRYVCMNLREIAQDSTSKMARTLIARGLASSLVYFV